MNFNSFAQQFIPVIESRLKTIVTPHLPDGRNRLESAIAYSVLAPAKRVRPLLVLAAGQEYDPDPAKMLDLACSIELVHCYSLIHDDLPAMDDDDLRRGLPTCHKQFDDATAILAGDTLQCISFELLAEQLPKLFPVEKVLATIGRLAKIYGIVGLTGGQMLDLYPDFSGSLADKQQRLTQIHRLKTGSLLAACVTIPGELYGESGDRLAKWEKFGQSLGLLFQIVDDILDVTSSREVLGKSIAKDIDQNKMTYVSLWGLEGAQKMAAAEAEQARQCLRDLNCRHTVLLDLVNFIHTRDR